MTDAQSPNKPSSARIIVRNDDAYSNCCDFGRRRIKLRGIAAEDCWMLVLGQTEHAAIGMRYCPACGAALPEAYTTGPDRLGPVDRHVDRPVRVRHPDGLSLGLGVTQEGDGDGY